MKTTISILLMLVSVSGWSYWEFQRNSVPQNNQIFVRCEIEEEDVFLPEILFLDNGIVNFSEMQLINDFSTTYEGVIPFDDRSFQPIGFRIRKEEQNFVIPVGLNSDNLLFDQLSLTSNDIVDDCTVEFENLEILSDHIGTNDDLIIGSIRNESGTFPTNEGYTFFSYMLAFLQPGAEENDIVFGMIYTVEQPGIMEPGLYKITGESIDEMIKIGDIDWTVDQENNALVMACEWEQLINDEDFMAWFDPENPVFGYVSMTQKITLTEGVQVADEGKFSYVYPTERYIELGNSTQPVLSNLTEFESEDGFFLKVDFFDAESHFPVLAELEFDNGMVRSFYPQSADYSESVTYQSEDISDIIVLDDWSQAIIRFSEDNINMVELIYPETSTTNDQMDHFSLRIYPNPISFSQQKEITLRLEQDCNFNQKLKIFNVKGQMVKSLAFHERSGSYLWNGKDMYNKKVQSGIYFIHSSSQKNHSIKKILVLP